MPSFRVQFSYAVTSGGTATSLYVADTFDGVAVIVDKGDATVAITAGDEASAIDAAARLTILSTQ